MAFNLFEIFKKETKLLSASEQQNAIINILLYTSRIDGHIHENEAKHIERILAHRYELDEKEIHQKMTIFDKMNLSDAEALAEKLCDSMPYDDRVLMLRDIWAVALADGVASRNEEAILHRVARMLKIPNNDFFNNCIKVNKHKKVLTKEQIEQRKQDAVIGILLYTICADRQTDGDEIDRIISTLAERYERSHEDIWLKIKDYERMTWSDFETRTEKLCDKLDVDDRKLLLKDIRTVAMTDGMLHRTEEAILRRVAEILETPNHADFPDTSS